MPNLDELQLIYGENHDLSPYANLVEHDISQWYKMSDIPEELRRGEHVFREKTSDEYGNVEEGIGCLRGPVKTDEIC